MRKVILSINVTLDGYLDHTAMIADEELHKYAAGQVNNADIILFGRETYQLKADFWPTVNGGMAAVLYCFIWLYFSTAGSVSWS